MERKGIRTEKGDIYRENKKQNQLLKAIGEEIRKITGWLSDFKDRLKTAYQEHKEETKLSVENESGLFNLYEYLSFYQEMQDMKRTALSPYAKRNKTLYDLKKYANGVLYLRSNNIRTVSELQSHISELRTENNQIFKAVNEKTHRIENLNKCFGYAETIKATQKTFTEWQNKKIFKDNFYNAHKKEIEQCQRAR
ncbi:MAG: hypothetical protein QM204_02305 [Bacillota bacterium]|nr:hypothetical protein [Bacillota bacterium]